MAGYRHPPVRPVSRYSDAIEVKTYPNGERRVVRNPTASSLQDAIQEFGTVLSVARAYGVDRSVVRRWIRQYGLEFTSHPEAMLPSIVGHQLKNETDRVRIAQWIMDEGSVSVTYFWRGDYTSLLVCGSMNDYSVLSELAKLLNVPIVSAKLPELTRLPMGSIRVRSGTAYALLELVSPYLVGLKAKEAKAALDFFPRKGTVKGRHTTDEFLRPAWIEHATSSLSEWNKRRRTPEKRTTLDDLAKSWVAGRVRRARRFVDSQREGSDS